MQSVKNSRSLFYAVALREKGLKREKESFEIDNKQ